MHRVLRRGLVLFLLLPSAVYAATLPAGFTETQINGLANPTAMEFAPDGRIFVCQQGGSLRVIKNGVLLSTPFLTLSVDANGERGLLGIAFDPNFASNNFLYVYYTVPSTPRHNRVSRFTANGDVVVPGSEQIILELDNLSSATNHNGGAIHFGPDGKLYVAVGENANGSNAQTLSNRLGKVLRINSDGSIPADNPFFNTATGANRSIWAFGLRNPFTFAFQPGTGRMFINDVGEVTWEEINDGIAGSNYGWNLSEGPTTNPQFRSPLFAYQHGGSATTGCAIAGGAFYNPATVQFPQSFVGKYFFADLCSGWIRVFDPATGTVSGFATNISNPVDLKVGADGSLYYLARGSSSVFRVQFLEPMLISEGSTDSGIVLDSVTFIRDPFPLTNLFNFSADKRTRLMMFGMNMELMAGEDKSAVTARAEDASLNVYPLTVEFVGKVPGIDELTQIVVRLPDNTPTGQTLFVSATLRGKMTNRVRVRMQ
ncbi:MAG TPA: PQQ-dependent sugar dehydrogenase [Pyrinomonadaceae bacterium]|nr:PQQ-dependent sugar dehydrogenase [Pyrinomonadaceae bacterium]